MEVWSNGYDSALIKQKLSVQIRLSLSLFATFVAYFYVCTHSCCLPSGFYSLCVLFFVCFILCVFYSLCVSFFVCFILCVFYSLCDFPKSLILAEYMSNAMAAGVNAHRKAACSMLSTIMPHEAAATEDVRMLLSLLGLTCWQCTHAVNVVIVIYRKRVSINSMLSFFFVGTQPSFYHTIMLSLIQRCFGKLQFVSLRISTQRQCCFGSHFYVGQ